MNQETNPPWAIVSKDATESHLQLATVTWPRCPQTSQVRRVGTAGTSTKIPTHSPRDQIANIVLDPLTPLRIEVLDFPSGPVVKSLPANTEDTSSIPGWGTKIPHAAGQLNPLQLLSPSITMTANHSL